MSPEIIFLEFPSSMGLNVKIYTNNAQLVSFTVLSLRKINVIRAIIYLPSTQYPNENKEIQ